MHKRSLGIRSTGGIFGLPRMVYSPRYSQEWWWGCRLLCCRQQQMSTRTPQMLHSHPCRALQSVSELIWACCSGKNVTITCLMSPMVQELSCSQTHKHSHKPTLLQTTHLAMLALHGWHW